MPQGGTLILSTVYGIVTQKHDHILLAEAEPQVREFVNALLTGNCYRVLASMDTLDAAVLLNRP